VGRDLADGEPGRDQVWATGAPYEAEPSIPILASGATTAAQAASSTKPAGSQLNVRSSMTLPTSSTAQVVRRYASLSEADLVIRHRSASPADRLGRKMAAG
jgi:hypothetical protein